MASEAGALAPPISQSATREHQLWPLVDRIGFLLCWLTGIGLCLVAGGIVLYMLFKGVAYLQLSQFVTSPRHRCIRPRAAASATRSSARCW